MDKKLLSLILITILMGNSLVPIFVSAKAKAFEVVEVFQTSSAYDLGIDCNNVRLAWKIESRERNVFQSQYQLQIRDDKEIVFDSGWVKSSMQTGIKAMNLVPETVYYWKVNVKDQKGRESGFSKEASFETAPEYLLGEEIGGPGTKLLRHTFVLDQEIKNIRRARSYFASASLIETRLNGQKVGDLVLSPRKPIPDIEIFYNTYDILPYLLEGQNTVGIMVSDAYPMGSSAKGMIKIYYENGESQIIETNGNWRGSSQSPIVRTNIQSGEDINLNLLEGWDTNSFSDKSFKAVSVGGMNTAGGKLSVPSNAGSYYSVPSFTGDYEIEVKVSSDSVFALLLGDGKPNPLMWQFTNNSIRKHQAGDWTNIDVVNTSGINLHKGAIIRLSIEGTTIKSFVNGKLLDTSNIPKGITNGKIGFRAALNESFEIDYIKVSKGNNLVFEDNFDRLDRDKWNISIADAVPALVGTRVIEEIEAIDIIDLGKDTYVIDFGQNVSGYVKMIAKGEKNQSVTIRYSELLNESGKLYPNTTFHMPSSKYTMTGKDDVFEPRFFYTGFRYIEVSGFKGKPSKENFISCFVSDDLDITGEFSSSNERLNKIYSMYYYAQRSNMVGNYTDCPQREKQGWGGDASVTKESASIILNDYTAAESFMKILKQNIFDDGRPSCIVPHVSTDRGLYDEFDIPWASVYFTFPYYTYMQTQDPYYIEMTYDSLVEVYEYFKLSADSSGYVIPYNRYGDWLGYDNQEGLLDRSALSTSYFYYCGSLLVQMGKVIGRDTKDLENFLAKVKEAYSYKENQTSLAMALDFGLVEKSKISKMETLLKNKVKEANSTLRTGVLGTMSLYNALSNANMHDVLLAATITGEKCSFGYMLDNGATTMWEYWDKAGETFNSFLSPDKIAGWDSQNHCMMGGGFTTWLYEGLAGIRMTSAGYSEFDIRPGIESSLDSCFGSIDSIRGEILSSWKVEGNSFEIDIKVPVNSKAKVYIPSKGIKSVTESGNNLYKKSYKEIKYLGKERDFYTYEIGSGDYKFIANESEFAGTNLLPVILGSVGGALLLGLGIVLVIKKSQKPSKSSNL